MGKVFALIGDVGLVKVYAGPALQRRQAALSKLGVVAIGLALTIGLFWRAP